MEVLKLILDLHCLQFDIFDIFEKIFENVDRLKDGQWTLESLVYY